MRTTYKFNTDTSIVDRLVRTARSHLRFMLKSQYNLSMTEIREDYFKLRVIVQSCAGFELKDENDRYKGDWLLAKMGNEFLDQAMQNDEMIGIPADHTIMLELHQRVVELVNENKLASAVELTRLATQTCDELFADFYRRHSRMHELLNELDRDTMLAQLSIDEIMTLNIYEMTRRQLQVITSVMLYETFDARIRLQRDEEVTDDETDKLEFVDTCLAHLFMDKLFTNP